MAPTEDDLRKSPKCGSSFVCEMNINGCVFGYELVATHTIQAGLKDLTISTGKDDKLDWQARL
jgi:hypothetical protein